ncbi:MAG TPA: hypothetical protein PLR78_16270 [Polaromonas sp.]|nr:hypothetical protein [Polaromonas sp.]HQS33330.1 hypothetical protein [Polaromonas sp.]
MLLDVALLADALAHFVEQYGNVRQSWQPRTLATDSTLSKP